MSKNFCSYLFLVFSLLIFADFSFGQNSNGTFRSVEEAERACLEYISQQQVNTQVTVLMNCTLQAGPQVRAKIRVVEFETHGYFGIDIRPACVQRGPPFVEGSGARSYPECMLLGDTPESACSALIELKTAGCAIPEENGNRHHLCTPPSFDRNVFIPPTSCRYSGVDAEGFAGSTTAAMAEDRSSSFRDIEINYVIEELPKTQQCPKPRVANPVDYAYGIKFESANDYTGSGLFPLAVSYTHLTLPTNREV